MQPEQPPEPGVETNARVEASAFQEAVLERLEAEIAEVEAELSSLEE
ncbi:MAG: hypothetical protein M0Z91_02035 [Actinomycetota bacterium]|nr:hypothetical protein [Actinomycetota bacterium]